MDSSVVQNCQNEKNANDQSNVCARPSQNTSMADNITTKAKLKAEIDFLKEKLRKLKLVDVYKKKWTVAALSQSIEDWTSTGQSCANELYSRISQDYPDVTREQLAKNFRCYRQLSHIDNLDQALEEVFRIND